MTAHSAQSEVDAVASGTHNNPFGFLGMHELRGDGSAPPEIVVRTFQPRAAAVQVIDRATDQIVATLDRVHPHGVFASVIPGRTERFGHRFRMEMPEGTIDVEDPYRFPAVLGELDMYLLGEGNHLRNYEKMGAHPIELEGVPGTSFAVWAPNAQRVSVVGDWNHWDGRVHVMRLRHDNGIWEIFIPHVGRGAVYKFEIVGPNGNLVPLKADPYAFYAEVEPKTGSVVWGLPRHQWQDQEWMERRAAAHSRDAPISIYEVHLGSWQRVPEEGLRFLTYRELAERLVSYAKEMGFTHLELLPVSEHPFGGSWGYQPIGLYAATSRFGTPEDFQYFVDRCHQEGIGVLIDWVPGHFPTDQHGLGWFDGTHLYEHADPRKGFHMDWNTLIYNYGRREVANFLLGNALFWYEHFHIDGVRVDAVASMLYLDYSRKAGEWIPNQYGGNENLEAISLIKRMNELVFGTFPGATTVAEESTAWPAVSRPIYAGGLGFGYKWNMGWMNDTLRYMSKDAIHRRWHHNDLTFGLLYAFSENFILPLSHDEVVHGKGSLISKMSGDDWQKFANLRAYYGFMWTQPGKKLLFMGCEFGQWREWDNNTSLDWHQLDYEPHAGVQRVVRDLNILYRDTPALHQLDTEWTGFEWVEPNDIENSVISYLRKGREGTAPVLVLGNFTPVPRQGYRVGVPVGGFWIEKLNTDAALYGGSNVGNAGGLDAEEVPSHGRPFSLVVTIPPLGTVILQPRDMPQPVADIETAEAAEEGEEAESAGQPAAAVEPAGSVEPTAPSELAAPSEVTAPAATPAVPARDVPSTAPAGPAAASKPTGKGRR